MGYCQILRLYSRRDTKGQWDTRGAGRESTVVDTRIIKTAALREKQCGGSMGGVAAREALCPKIEYKKEEKENKGNLSNRQDTICIRKEFP